MQKSVVFARGNLFLGVWSLFLVCGNFFRMLPLAPFPSSFSILELLLYALAIPSFFLRNRKSLIIGSILTCSVLYGILLHGFILSSILYAVRLFGMISAGYLLGNLLYLRHGVDWKGMLAQFLFPYHVLVLIGFCIFFLFPQAEAFFETLSGWGILFEGDPHQRRFISSFFDPNYYCAIAVLPLITCWLLRHRAAIYRFFFFAFATSILLTWSRSGLATVCLTSIAFPLTTWRGIRVKTLIIGCGFCTVTALLLVSFRAEAFHFFSRLLGWLEDPSAQARLISLAAASQYFLRSPFLGMGYNFLAPQYSEELGNLAPDSSFFLTLTCFGLIPSLLALAALTIFLLRLWKQSPPEYRIFLRVLYIYLGICILFTSQFNNLLYYPYWFVPMLALFTYSYQRGSSK